MAAKALAAIRGDRTPPRHARQRPRRQPRRRHRQPRHRRRRAPGDRASARPLLPRLPAPGRRHRLMDLRAARQPTRSLPLPEQRRSNPAHGTHPPLRRRCPYSRAERAHRTGPRPTTLVCDDCTSWPPAPARPHAGSACGYPKTSPSPASTTSCSPRQRTQFTDRPAPPPRSSGTQGMPALLAARRALPPD